MTTRVALVGVGRWGRRLLPELRSRFDVEVCCTLGESGGAAWLRRRHPEIRRSTDVAAVIAEPAVDAVVIATPMETHARLAAAALEAGKHVFVEKPMATSKEDAAALLRLAARSARVLFVGHVYLYDPALERLGRMLAGDAVDSAHFTWEKLGTFDSDLFWNLVSHDVSTALALVGGRVEEAEVLYVRGEQSTCDVAIVRLRFAGGADVVIEVDRLSARKTKGVRVRTRSGSTLVWQDGVLHELHDGAFRARYRPRARSLSRELDAFRAAVEDGRSFPSGAPHGAAVVETVARLRAAAGRVG